jgi:hypothetical protein
MKNELPFQGQHRISQIYLKQFGYKQHDEWYVSVYEAGKKETSVEKISDFTKETNIYDLPFQEIIGRRLFENISSLVENRYPTLISNLVNQKKLIEKDSEYLSSVIANFLCRSLSFRNSITNIVNDESRKKVFINEIASFLDNEEEILKAIEIIKPEYQLNILFYYLFLHLSCVFTTFEKVIIEDSNNLGWLTTDNPVFINFNNNNDFIIPITCEIYFPISKNYLAYLYHSKFDSNENQLKNLKTNKISKVGYEIFKEITDKIAFNYDRFLIFSEEIQISDVTKN